MVRTDSMHIAHSKNVDQGIELFKKKDVHDTRPRALAVAGSAIACPRRVRFSGFGFPASHDVSAVTGDDWKRRHGICQFASGRQSSHKSKAGEQEKTTAPRAPHFQSSLTSPSIPAHSIPICLQAEAWYRILTTTTSRSNDQLRQPNFRTTTPAQQLLDSLPTCIDRLMDARLPHLWLRS